MRLDRYCLQACTYLGQDPIVTRTKKSNSVELNTVQGWAVSRYLSPSLPFCVSFNASVTRHAATLDTRPVANSYPGGSHTHLSTNHFQYARAPLCSLLSVSIQRLVEPPSGYAQLGPELLSSGIIILLSTQTCEQSLTPPSAPLSRARERGWG